MTVVCLGLSYRTAPVELLERLAVPADRLEKALADLRGRPHVREAVVLSTCNRVEVYAHVSRFHGGAADLRDFLAEWGGLAPEEFSHLAYDYFDDRAAAHLFAVASGLDSMVVGERQIHSQVRAAYAAAAAEGASGRLLGELFRRAVHAGRAVHQQTAVNAGASSLVDVGLAAANRVLGAIDGRTVLVIGAGKIGGMGARRVAARAARVLVANRSAERAAALAQRTGGQELPLDRLVDGLAAADLVLACTGASQPVVTADAVAAAMAQRPQRPLVLVDLAIPRDIEPPSAAVPGVTVLDLDALRADVDRGPAGAELAKARDLVEDAARDFAAWTREVQVGPTVGALHEQVEALRRAELARLAGRPDLDEAALAAIDAATRRVLGTVLHEPTVRLKAAAGSPDAEVYSLVLAELFGLDVPGAGEPGPA